MTFELIKEFYPSDFTVFDKNALANKKTIYRLAKEFCAKNYAVSLTIPIEYRLSSVSKVQGKFIHTDYTNGKKVPNKIIMNLSLLYAYQLGFREYFFQVLEHELIHYCLYVLDEDCDDGDFKFEHELLIHNAVSSAATSSSKRQANVACNGFAVRDVYSITDDENTNIQEYRHSRRSYNTTNIDFSGDKPQVKVLNRLKIRVYRSY